MLGLYDSGLGGLTVLAALRRAGVAADIVYFADQAHVPYGDRTDADLYRLLSENFAALDARGVDTVVMACNTSCAVAARRGGFPPTRGPVLDLIRNAADALRAAPYSRIAVLATVATVRSGAYRDAIARAAPRIDVVEIAAPALVPLVEAGRAGSRAAGDAVRAVCAMLPRGVDAVLYGCTHYPLLDEHFAAALGTAVARIDPAIAQAAATAALLGEPTAREHAVTHYLTNGDVGVFEAHVRRWTGERSGTFASAVTQLCAPSARAAS